MAYCGLVRTYEINRANNSSAGTSDECQRFADRRVLRRQIGYPEVEISNGGQPTAGNSNPVLAEAIGGEAAKPRKAVFLGMRYVILGGCAYVILKYSAISLPAALSGLFVSVAAVIVEILLELAYARNGTVDH